MYTKKYSFTYIPKFHREEYTTDTYKDNIFTIPKRDR